MKKTIGVLAHVDAGKTTFSESLLFHTNTISKKGRVDHKNSYLDTHEIERNRGITIFADQAVMHYKDSTYYLIDTPGHIDFTPEMERSIMVMDYAIIILSAVEGVQGHTETVWQLLRKYNVPTFFFINKTDRVGADVTKVFNEIYEELSEDVCLFNTLQDKELLEFAALRDEELLELYSRNECSTDIWLTRINKLIKDGNMFPCQYGSALKDEGVLEFFSNFHHLTNTSFSSTGTFVGRVYKISHSKNGTKITHLKVVSGMLSIRDEITYKIENEIVTEKITKIQECNGAKYTNKSKAEAGEIIAVTGLTKTFAGQTIGANGESITSNIQPTLKSKVIFDSSLNTKEIVNIFYQINEEDPSLNVTWDENLQELYIHVMGPIQLEVLEKVIEKRFSIAITFDNPKILYKETIANEVNGYGHYEPYRHYAEIHLKIKSGPRNSGIKFNSCCHVDALNRGSQNLVQQHIFEKEHRGLLTGSPLTDMEITLLTGRIHNEHTCGGDIKQATLRALRQGLEKANSVLLEPYYRFRIKVNHDNLGRVLADIQKRNGEFEAPEIIDNKAIIHGRVPVTTFMDYPLELRSFTGGKGMIQLVYGGYDKCHNSNQVIKQIAYDKDADREYSSSSVFCGKGKTFNVPWYEAEEKMHCIIK